MSGDQRRDRDQSEGRSRASSQRGEDTSSDGGHAVTHEREFDHPTHPRRNTIGESESPSESRISVNGPVLRATQDSFNPVRVAARSLRPSLSLWTRAWATVALVIVVAGGAVGIVAGLRGRTFGSGWRSAPKDRSNAVAAPQASALGVDGHPKRAAVPAAAAGYTAPPIAPPQAAPRGAASSTSASVPSPAAQGETSTAAPVAAAPSRVSPGPVSYRTTESLAISPPAGHSSAASPSRRAKPTENEPRSISRPTLSDEAPKASTPAPTTSAAPETKGESEAWVTEERRF
jgi:hypothetical protein